MTFTNCIEINGETRKREELSEKEKEEIGIVLKDRLMAAAGYRRVGGQKCKDVRS